MIKRLICNLFFSLGILSIGLGQSQIAFEKRIPLKFRSEVKAITKTKGGYLLAGGIYKPGTSFRHMYPFVVHTNRQGKVVWVKYFNQYPGRKWFISIHPNGKGGFVLIGRAAQEESHFLVQLSQQGEILSSETMGQSFGRIRKVKEDSNKNLLMTGDRNYEISWIRMSKQGQMRGLNSFASPSESPNFTRGYDITQVNDGYLIAGIFDQESMSNFAVLKINNRSQKVWIKRYSDKGEALFVKRTRKSDIYLAGGRYDNYNRAKRNAYLVKFNNQGDTLWTRRMGDNEGDELIDIYVTHNNEYLALVSSMKRYRRNIQKGLLMLFTFKADGTLKNKEELPITYPAGYRPIKLMQTAKNQFIILANALVTYRKMGPALIKFNYKTKPSKNKAKYPLPIPGATNRKLLGRWQLIKTTSITQEKEGIPLPPREATIWSFGRQLTIDVKSTPYKYVAFSESKGILTTYHIPQRRYKILSLKSHNLVLQLQKIHRGKAIPISNLYFKSANIYESKD